MASELTSLEGRVIAIAGSGGNLGPTVVRRLAPTGARLALGGRHKTPLDELTVESNLEADTADVDLLDPSSAAAWASGIAERLRRIDALVHLVGGWGRGPPNQEG